MPGHSHRTREEDTTMSNMELAIKARDYREIQAEIKALEEQADALRQAMITEMDAQKVDGLDVGGYTIRYTVYESGRLDSAKLKRELPDVHAAYTKQTVATRFCVA